MRVDESLVYRPLRLCELVRECSSQVCIRHTFQEDNQRVNWVLSSRNHCKVNINGLRIKKISVPVTRYDTSFWWEFDHGTNKSLAHFVSDKQSEPSSDWIIAFADGEFHQLYIESSLESDGKLSFN